MPKKNKVSLKATKMCLENKQKRQKKLILKTLKKMPIIQIACQNCNVARSTFYRWRDEDYEFAKLVDEVLIEGTELINDLAVSKLISGIKNANNTCIIFWLKNKHKDFIDKKKINHNLSIENPQKFTSEDEVRVRKALINVGMGDILDPPMTKKEKNYIPKS